MSSPNTNKTAVEVKNLTVKYDNNVVLEDISFAIEPGKIIAIIGPNGSGKTTLLKSILGLIKIAHGEISILDQPLHHVNKAIGYVPQRFEFDKSFPITVEEFMRLALHRHGDERHISRAIKDVGLNKPILSQTLGSLSGGQLQRTLIAQAIINDPSILILDEPSTGIDITGEAAFMDVIKHLNQVHKTTVLIVSHEISMISRAVDDVICLNKKLMCFGPPRKTLSEKQLEKVFGEESSLYRHHKH